MPSPAPEIFKAYDIRGIVDTVLTPAAVRAIGHALGSEAVARGQTAIAVGRDGRLSGPALAGALADGIRAAGVDVYRHRLRAHPAHLLRRVAARLRLLRVGHRQPQPAGLQRPEDGPGRPDPVTAT